MKRKPTGWDDLVLKVKPKKLQRAETEDKANSEVLMYRKRGR